MWFVLKSHVSMCVSTTTGLNYATNYSFCFQTPWIKNKRSWTLAASIFNFKCYTDENICRLHISISSWSPGHPDQKVGRSTGDLRVGGFQHSSSLFSTLSSVIHGSFLTWSPLLPLLPPLVHPPPFSSSLSIQSTVISSQKIHCSVYSPWTNGSARVRHRHLSNSNPWSR